jgi:hypothetical protein
MDEPKQAVLNGENYTRWKFEIRNLLESKDLLGPVDVTDTCLPEADAAKKRKNVKERLLLGDH